MKKICFLLIFAFGVTACGGEIVPEYVESLNTHELVIDGEEYYFLYPEKGVVVGERIEFSNGDCRVVNFGNFEKLKELIAGREDLENVFVNTGSAKGGSVETWKVDDVVVLYGRSVEGKEFGIWAFRDAKDISSCKLYVDNIFDSLTDKISHMRAEYGFDVYFPEIFNVEYFEHGVFLTRQVGDYHMGIGIKSFENESGHKFVGDYVASEYPGYSIDFVEFENVSGYYVDRAVENEAIRHFFVLSSNGREVYEMYLKVPGVHFSDHLEEFEEMLRTFRIF